LSTTMAARVSISKAKEIDTAIELLKRHILILRSNGSLVKNTDAYKRQLHAQNEQLKQQVEDLKRQLVDAEEMNGRRQIDLTKNVLKSSLYQSPSVVMQTSTTQAFNNTKLTTEPKSEQGIKKKKEGVKKQGKAAGPVAKPADNVDVSRLDMRVGFIRSAKLHPEADGLYMEVIDCGEPEPRQILSGLVKNYSLEEMQQRPCVVMCNLKPAKMRGIVSYGMVMCASSPDSCEILTPPADSKPGDMVTVEGFPGTPDAQLNPKKKVFEAVQPDFLVSEDGYALYKGVQWKINGKGVTSPSMRSCQIK